MEPSRIQQLEAELAAARRQGIDQYCIGKAELDLAVRVHQSRLPKPVRHPRIDIASRYVPANGIGGDYCQVLFPSDSSCSISICDVTGHGIGAALLATRVSSEVRRLTMAGCRPSEVLTELNSFILRHFRGTELQLSFFASRLDLQQRTITYSGAAHPSPLMIRATSGPVEPLKSRHVLLGVLEDCLQGEPERTLPLTPGDRILFFTDGLTETRLPGGGLLGEAGVLRIARRVHADTVFDLADRMLEHVASLRDGPARDDMTLMVAQMK